MSADEWLVSVVVIRTVCCCDILQKCVFIQNFTEMDKTREKVAENFVDAVSATVSKIRILTHSSKSKISLNWNWTKSESLWNGQCEIVWFASTSGVFGRNKRVKIRECEIFRGKEDQRKRNNTTKISDENDNYDERWRHVFEL